MSDISSRSDIVFLVDTFYSKVLLDKQIGFFFTDIVKISLENHMPIMYDFWASVLLDESTYKGNVMHKHIALDKMHRLDKSHFERWVSLWEEAVDNNYQGEIAEQAKQKAVLMKEHMLFKIKASRGDHFIQ